jgi:hypothetical protein
LKRDLQRLKRNGTIRKERQVDGCEVRGRGVEQDCWWDATVRLTRLTASGRLKFKIYQGSSERRGRGNKKGYIEDFNKCAGRYP